MVKSRAGTLHACFGGAALTLLLAALAALAFLYLLPWYQQYREMSSLFDELKRTDKTKVQKGLPIVLFGGPAMRPPLHMLPPFQDEALTSLLEKIVQRDDRAVPWLIDAMNDEDDDMRLCAIFTLGQIGPKSQSAASAVLAVMKDKNEILRCHAAMALKRIEPKNLSAVPVMIAALQDESPTLRRLALSYLKDVGPDARLAVPALIKIIQSSEHSGARSDAIYVLGEIGPEARAAVPALLRAQRDEIYIADAAARAVSKIGGSAVPPLVDALQNGNELSRIHAANLLGRIGSPAAISVPVLIDALQDESRDVRYAAVRALGNIGPNAKEAITPLIKTLQDDQSLVREAADYALKQIDRDAWMELAGN
jgi:HEAT repeat protein